jgi:hypothetical protein
LERAALHARGHEGGPLPSSRWRSI